jgi:hypothetical protein
MSVAVLATASTATLILSSLAAVGCQSKLNSGAFK